MCSTQCWIFRCLLCFCVCVLVSFDFSMAWYPDYFDSKSLSPSSSFLGAESCSIIRQLWWDVYRRSSADHRYPPLFPYPQFQSKLLRGIQLRRTWFSMGTTGAIYTSRNHLTLPTTVGVHCQRSLLATPSAITWLTPLHDSCRYITLRRYITHSSS